MAERGRLGDEVWFVVFTKSNHPHWVFRWINKERQHCYAVKKSRGGQYWLVMNAKKSHIELELEPLSIYPVITDLVDSGDEVLRVRIRYNPYLGSAQLSIVSCVDIVKRALGIKDWLCWTPNQLYNRIIRGNYEQNIKSWGRQSKESSRSATRSTSKAETGGRLEVSRG